MESQEYLLINDEAERGVFYKKTYLHVALSILAFIVLETLLIKLVPYDFIVWMISGKFIWLFLLGCFWLGLHCLPDGRWLRVVKRSIWGWRFILYWRQLFSCQ